MHFFSLHSTVKSKIQLLLVFLTFKLVETIILRREIDFNVILAHIRKKYLKFSYFLKIVMFKM